MSFHSLASLQMISFLTALLLCAPLLGAGLNGFSVLVRACSRRSAGFLACFSVLVSFVSAGLLFAARRGQTPLTVSFFKWVDIKPVAVNFSFLLDSLSLVLLLVVTGVGFLIHVFSVYYMADDKSPARYFAYLNLFMFSMMLLILADNLLVMFIGWEGVGLCSYLLIGFWFQDAKKAAAGMKAFLINRIGDAGFLIGIFILLSYAQTLNFAALPARMPALDQGVLWPVWAGLFLLAGAVGKSAQIPLFVWLPSAMAGPTPVSALIHAATMVTAGVYLMCRLSFLFAFAPLVLTVIGYVGALGALLAGLSACVQTDIKKVLAYSTISQLGYMFAAVGVGAFSAAVFHLTTHAFFKALLFLAAGAVIHALKGEQNIFKMGGLKTPLPFVYGVFLIGGLALMGWPPFAGFFSKDEILWKAFASKHFGIFILLLMGSLLTAFYMTRLFVLVFHARPAAPRPRLHEGGFLMKAPLLVLAVLAFVGGGLGLPHAISNYLPGHPPHYLENFLSSSLVQVKFLGSVQIEIWLMAGGLFLSLLSAGAAFYFYSRPQPIQFKKWFEPFKETFKHAGFVDHFYQKSAKRVLSLSGELKEGVDFQLLQGSLRWLVRFLSFLRDSLLSFQTGRLQDYALFMLLGILGLMLLILIG